MTIEAKVYVDPGLCKVDDARPGTLPSPPMSPSVCAHCGQVHAPDETCPQLKRARDKRAAGEAIPIEIADTKPAPSWNDATTAPLFLGRYQMLEKLGEGGMGEVWKARDTQLPRFVAIKKMLPSIASRRDFVQRFESEAAKAAAVEHENIVTVYERGRDDGTPYYIMQLVEGRTLRQEMARQPRRRLPLRQAIDYTIQVLETLAVAHRTLIHRDLKPSNIMLVSVVRKGKAEDAVKILDFGIAKFLEGETTELTVPGRTPGTPPYQAPELLLGDNSREPNIDLYAVGAMLYEMLSGKVPWDPDKPAASTARKTPTLLRDSFPELEVPAHIDQAIARAIAFEPTKRFKRADEFLAALQQPDLEALTPGTVVADIYRIEGKVGQGGHAIVYKAIDQSVDRPCCLKFLRNPKDADLRARFSVDAKAAASIEHPNVVKVYGTGEWNGYPYVAMEYVDGATLRAKWRHYSWERLLNVIRQLGAALDATHRKGIVHRDIAPENILVDRRGVVRLIDFGIAKQPGSDLTKTNQNQIRQLGRYGYMAPEQAKDPRRADERTDQWSLSALVYEALTGIPPYCDPDIERFEDAERAAYSERLLSGNPPAIVRAFNETVPAELDDVLLRALAWDADARFPTIDDLVAALVQVAAKKVILNVFEEEAPASQSGAPMAFAVEPKTRPRRSRTATVAALSGALLLAAAGVALWMPFWKHQNPAASPATSAPAVRTAPPQEPPPSLPQLAASRVPSIEITLRTNVAGAEALVDGQRISLPTTLTRPKGVHLTAHVERLGYKPEVVEMVFDGSEPAKSVTLTAEPARKKGHKKVSPYDRPLFQEAEPKD